MIMTKTIMMMMMMIALTIFQLFLIKLGCPIQYARNDYNGLLVRNNCCINKVNHPVC